MSRPEFITNEDIARWSDNIDSDPEIPDEITDSAIMREVCYAGLWLLEELEKLQCTPELMVRIQYSAGQSSFGRDPWEIHQLFISNYIDNKLIFEDDPDTIKN